jgi:hypothetical protein
MENLIILIQIMLDRINYELFKILAILNWSEYKWPDNRKMGKMAIDGNISPFINTNQLHRWSEVYFMVKY